MKRMILLAALFALVITVVSGCFLLPKEEEALEPPLVKPAEVEYKTFAAELSNIEKTIIVQGKFRPANEITMSFEERGGYLLSAACKYGQEVKEGDLLFELDIDDMEMEQKTAELNLEKATLTYERVKSRTSSVYDRRMAEIDMELRQIAYDKITMEIEKSKIFAPMDGVVTYMSNANVGDYINAQKAMAKISDKSELRLIVEGDDAVKLDFGATVYVEITVSGDSKEYEGEVLMSPYDKPENMEESFEEPTAIIEVKGFDASKAKINQTAKIKIVENSAEDVIVIRRNLIKNYFGRTFVYVLEDGVKVERDVDIGITSNTMAEIREGLEVGDMIITN